MYSQLKPIFIQNEVPALMFSWQLSEIFNNNFLKEQCCKKKKTRRIVGQMSIVNLITQLFI